MSPPAAVALTVFSAVVIALMIPLLPSDVAPLIAAACCCVAVIVGLTVMSEATPSIALRTSPALPSMPLASPAIKSGIHVS